MAMVVNHNIPALSTYNVINSTSNALQKSINKLSTGLRINSAADDAAGLAISEKMRAQVRGLDQAVANSQDGISMIQTAEGALSETHSILQRMRELSVQAANDTLTQQDRGYIQEEVDQLREEITRIGNTTQFNKKKLLNGDAAVLWSSDNLETKAVINGGLRTIDQFGQKSSAEGNYKITVKATPGQGEVQKTDIMRLKHDVSPWYAKIDSTKGVAEATLQKSPDIKGGGVYSVQATMPDADVTASSNLTSQVGGVAFNTVGTVDGTNANVKFTVKDVNTTVGSESITFEVTGQTIGKDGTVADLSKQTLTYKAGTLTNNVSVDGNDVAFTWTGDIANIASRTQKGDEMVYNLTAKAVKNDGDVTITVKGSPESGVMQDHKYVINKNQTRDKELEFKVSYVETDKDNPDLKEVQDGSVYLTTNKKFADNVGTGTLVTYYKNVTPPADGEESWMTTLDTTVKSGSITGFPDGGSYKVNAQKVGAASDGSWDVLQATGKDYINATDTSKLTVTDQANIDASGILVLEIGTSTLHATPGSASLAVTGHFYGTKNDGTAIDEDITALSLVGDGTAVQVEGASGEKLGKLNVTSGSLAVGTSNFKAGDKIYIQVGAKQAAGDVVLSVSGKNEDGKSVFQNYTPKVVIDSASVAADKEYSLSGLVFNKDGENIDFDADLTSSDKVGSIALTTSALADADKMHGKTVAEFNWGVDNAEKIKSSIGEVATSSNKLYDVEKFWDSQGVFMLNDPQTLTLTQGDGKQASVTLYKNDTLGSVAKKLNDAIANDLGQGKYVDDKSKFVTFVDKPTDDETSESVKGTMLIRTAISGANGTISISGNEDLINAFSLNTIQKASESNYKVSIEDAHSGKSIVKDEIITGNKLIGVLNPNVDVEFDNMAGIKAEWDNGSKSFKTSSEDYTTYLHLSDNTTVFQIGANEGEDMGINIGDMRSHALGLDSVLVTDRESAARSITVIDNAIDKVSMQRSKLGAYQNRLEHTINNLTTASENLTAAESRIRDTDMAKEMMNFSKLQIMLQAGNSMLAQANQLPQNVLSLVR